MNVVLLCKDESGVARGILEALRREGIPVQGVVAELRHDAPLTPARILHEVRGQSFPALCRKAFTWALGRRRKSRRGADPLTSPPILLSTFARSVGTDYFRVADHNGPEAVEILQRLRPDLIVLGGTRIIRRNVLDIPRLGTVNSHMGLLPKYRGMNVSEWSAFHGDPVGITVHFVDEGVDTGDILRTETVDVTDCVSIERLRAKVSRRQLQFLAECVRMLADGTAPPAQPQDVADGRQYYVMHPRLRELLESKLRRTAGIASAAQASSPGSNASPAGGG